MPHAHVTDRNWRRMAAFALGAGSLLALPALVSPAGAAAQYNQKISNDMSKCSPGAGPAMRVTVNGVSKSSGKIRIQSYRGTKEDWLEKGRWLSRIEVPAKAGSMTFCMPLPSSGVYGIAVRHDVNGNGKTDLTEDGGAMSNNPSLNIFNLGKPSYKKTQVSVGSGVESITINMRYM